MLLSLLLACQTAPDVAETTAPEPAPVAAAGPTYALDAEQSALYVVVYHDPDRVTPIKGHDHTVKASKFDGEVTWDAKDPGACNIRIEFPVTALVVDAPGMREREGLSAEGAVGDDAKQTIVKNMQGKMNLYADKFPSIAYQSTSCAQNGDQVDVAGKLTIRGVEKDVTVPMTIDAKGKTIHATGEVTLSHADFGMEPFTMGPGTPKNLEKLEFVIDVTGTRTSES